METSKWKWFRYQDIFDIQKGKRLTTSDMEYGEYPYIASGSTNNGVVAYVDDYTHQAGCITFACYGSIGEVFFHEKPIWASDNVNVLIFKEHQPNKYTGLFITSLLDQEKYRFSYGLTAKMDRLKNLKIKLPILLDGSPDWEWIESYVKNTLIPQLPHTAQELFYNDFFPKAISPKKLTLDTKSWKWFQIDILFDIVTSKDDNLVDAQEGIIPYISSSEQNNGLHSFIDVVPSQGQNTITVARIGSVGATFYHGYNYAVSSDNVRVLQPKFIMNKYIGIFLATLIGKEKYRYAYGRTFSTTRMKETKIKLPIIRTGTPDWQWMEEYIKSLPYSTSL